MAKPEDSNTPRILIVDDNPNIHRDFDLVLLDQGPNSDLEADERRMYGEADPPGVPKRPYLLAHALSGLEGVEKVKESLASEQPFQVAFVDIRMPGIDGVETIERLWRLDPRIQVVICTAYSDYSWEDLERRLGPTDKLLLLKKPFDNIEVTLLASTLAEKWFLARQAALKLEQMELLVAQRTRRVLELQRLEVPRLSAESSSAGTPEGAAAGGEPPLLLIVGATYEVGQVLRQGLGTDYTVLAANDAQQGLLEAHEAVPDLVITEMALPQLDGIEFCRRLKNDELASHIPIIVLGADGLEQTQIRALEAGADDFLLSPFGLPVLKARVDNLLRSRRRLQEHFSQENALQPRELAANQVEAQFLRRTLETIEKYASDFEFDVDVLAQKMGMSRRQLFRKFKGVTGLTPNALIRSVRLKRAAHLLKESQMTVTEITYAVGFSDLKHFRTVFKEEFGVLPGDYPKISKEKSS